MPVFSMSRRSGRSAFERSTCSSRTCRKCLKSALPRHRRDQGRQKLCCLGLAVGLVANSRLDGVAFGDPAQPFLGDPIVLAQCWAHARRKLIDATPKAGSPVAEEALRRIAALYAIEAEIRGRAPEDRRAVRRARSKPLVEALGAWLRAQKDRLSGSSKMGEAVRYILNGWGSLCVFLDDGRVEMDSNRVENLIRPHALTRKNALFAGHDEGAASWARIASLIGTCRMNGVEPYGYIKAVLEAITAGHPAARIDDFLPWAFAKPAEKAAA